MSQTVYGVNDPKAVRHYSGALFGSTMSKSFFARNMMVDAHVIGKDGQMANAPVVIINDLTSEAGDKVSFDLYAQLTGQPTYGDDPLENNLEDLSAYTDEIIINQVAHGVDAGGNMTQKRVLTDLRSTARVKLNDYFAAMFDQACVTTLSGARGVSNQLLIPQGATSAVAGTKPYDTYDSGHIAYGGVATSKASMVAADKMSLATIDSILTKISSEGGGADGAFKVTPIDKDSDDTYILMLSPKQENDLRTSTNTGGWLDIQKAAAGATGENSNLFKNTLGAYRGVYMRRYQHAVQFNDYGAGANVRADRAVLMGRQALAVAFGSASSKGLRADWKETELDLGRKLAVSAQMCYGLKLPMFNGKVVNSVAIDTAVAP